MENILGFSEMFAPSCPQSWKHYRKKLY